MVQGEDEEVEGKQHQEVFMRCLWGTHQRKHQRLGCDSSCIICQYCQLLVNVLCLWWQWWWRVLWSDCEFCTRTCIDVLRAGSSYLCVTVIEQHHGGVDDLSIHVGRLALPVPEWLLGVNNLVELIFAPAPQHHLLAKIENNFNLSQLLNEQTILE